MENIESRVNALERQQSNFDIKFEMYMQRMDKQLEQQQKNLDLKFEMYAQRIDRQTERMDRQTERLDRQAERLEKRQEQFEKRYEEDKRELRQEFRGIYQKLDELGRHTQNLTLAAIVGIGAIAIAAMGFAWSLIGH